MGLLNEYYSKNKKQNPYATPQKAASSSGSTGGLLTQYQQKNNLKSPFQVAPVKKISTTQVKVAQAPQQNVATDTITKLRNTNIPQQAGNILKAAKSLDYDRIKKAFTAGVKSTPGQVKTAGGIIAEGWVKRQKQMDNFFRATDRTHPIVGKLLRETAKQVVPGRRNYEIFEERFNEKGTSFQKLAGQAREKGMREQAKSRQPYAKMGAAKNGTQTVVEALAFNLPQMALSTGLTIGTGILTKNPHLARGVGMSTSYGMGANEVYVRARENNLTDKEAQPLAAIGGFLIGAIDFLPLNRLLGKTGAVETVKKGIMKKVAEQVVSTAKQSGFEGITESAQEIIGNAIESTYRENVDLFKGADIAGIVGVLTGGLADVSVGTVVGLGGKSKTPQQIAEEVNNKIEKAMNTPSYKRTPEQQEIADAALTTQVTPDEATAIVLDEKIENTDEGRQIMKTVLEAKKESKEISITSNEDGEIASVEIVDQTEWKSTTEGRGDEVITNEKTGETWENLSLPDGFEVYRNAETGETLSADELKSRIGELPKSELVSKSDANAGLYDTKKGYTEPLTENFVTQKVPANKIVSRGTEGSYDPMSYEYSLNQLKSGKKVPLIEVRAENGKYIITDGEHRYKAMKELGLADELEVRVAQQPKTDTNDMTVFRGMRSGIDEKGGYAGKFVTTSRENAQRYADKMSKGGEVREFSIPKNMNLLHFDSSEGDSLTREFLEELGEENGGIASGAPIDTDTKRLVFTGEAEDAWINFLKQKGYEGTSYNNAGAEEAPEIHVFDPSKIKPKTDTGARYTAYVPPETLNKVRAVQQKAKAIPPTIEINTPERKALRKKIADDLYGDGAKNKNKRVDIVLGLPAAGKSTVLAEPLAEKYGSLIIDPDMAKAKLPEFGDGEGAMATHEESSHITKSMEGSVHERAIKNGDNIVIPAIGDKLEKQRRQIQNFIDEGYEVHLHLNDVENRTSITRAIERFEKTGRYVDIDYIEGLGLTPRLNFDIIKVEKEITTYAKYSNEVEKGQPLKLLEKSDNYQELLSKRNGLERSGLQRVRDDVQSTEERTRSEEKPQTTSKIAKSIETKAIEQQLTKGFEDLAGYDNITIKEQAEMASGAMQDLDTARSIIRGEKPLPKGLRGTALITAAEEYIKKTGDADMAYDLANSPLISETSAAAQELRLAAEREPDSVAVMLQQVRDARVKNLKKRTGKSVDEATKIVEKDIRSKIKVPDKYDWGNFVSSLEC